MAKEMHFRWLYESARKTAEKKLEVVEEYRLLREHLTRAECKRELASRCGVTEIAATTLMEWYEKYGYDHCSRQLLSYLGKEKGGEG